MQVRHRLGEYEVEFCSLADAFAKIPAGSYVITDDNVTRHYEDPLTDFKTFTVPAGEKSKSLATYERLLEELADAKAVRSSTIVAFGGGVVGDLAGFIAASYMRGVSLVQIPTSLLAQVDSSVGGKVGLDLKAGKNLVGAFYPPQAVYIPLEALNTLPEREFTNGMAEVWKYGFIADPNLISDLLSERLTVGSDRLQNVIRQCIEIKKKVVEEDEQEKTGRRAILNFGHTMGHALEQIIGYGQILHGEAISIGMVFEAKLGEELGITEHGVAAKVSKCLASQGLPTEIPPSLNADRLLERMAGDKKRVGQGLSFSFLTHIGECKLSTGILESAVQSALNL